MLVVRNITLFRRDGEWTLKEIFVLIVSSCELVSKNLAEETKIVSEVQPIF